MLRSGRYTLDELMRLATEHDPGFNARMFAEALANAGRLPDAAFEPYGLTAAEAAAVRDRLVAWSTQITTGS
ncbi:MAG TPA: hypothetical protein VFX70_05720 [Mycobacteriales bacterium]|nr:hypothetical protein [Mycobacteriales bacterium]